MECPLIGKPDKIPSTYRLPMFVTNVFHYLMSAKLLHYIGKKCSILITVMV